MINEILSIFAIFLYAVLGTYVLTKNPHNRTNRFFAVMMLVFMVWALAVFTIGISLTSDISGFGFVGLSAAFGTKKELFLFCAVFAVAGIYLLLRHYASSRYREWEQTRIIIAGSIASISVVMLASIILPMFFDVYFLSLSILAPAVMGVFFAVAVYRDCQFIIPVPELSATSFCGKDCTICPEYIEKRCLGCRFDMTMYGKCAPYICAAEKGYTGCTECPEILSCKKRTEKILCFISKSAYQLKPGSMYMADDKDFDIFLDAVRNGAFGIIASTTNPYIIKERYGLVTTPMIWISEEGGESDVRPNDLRRLAKLLTNFMKKTENFGSSIVLLDGSCTLARANGHKSFERFIKMLGVAAISSKSNIIIINDQNNKKIETVFDGIENIEMLKYP